MLIIQITSTWLSPWPLIQVVTVVLRRQPNMVVLASRATSSSPSYRMAPAAVRFSNGDTIPFQ